MAKRLHELYQLGVPVEISFDGDHWFPAVVEMYNPPGLWVRSQNGRLWYVTNTRRIRLPDQSDAANSQNTRG